MLIGRLALQPQVSRARSESAPNAVEATANLFESEQQIEEEDKELQQRATDLFTSKPRASAQPTNTDSTRSQSISKAKKTIQLIDAQRSKNVAIGLARYQKHFTKWEDLCLAIVRLDQSVLDAERLEPLRKLLPSSEEIDIGEIVGLPCGSIVDSQAEVAELMLKKFNC